MTEFSQTYWNDLIEQYKEGTISKQDRFRLEKQALDDPFLFDALEGFALHNSEVAERRVGKGKLFTLPRIGIAASLILLLGFIFTMKTGLDNQVQEDQAIAMVLEDEKDEADNQVQVLDRDISGTVDMEEPAMENTDEVVAKKKEEKTVELTNEDSKAIADSDANKRKKKVSVPMQSPKKEKVNEDIAAVEGAIESEQGAGNQVVAAAETSMSQTESSDKTSSDEIVNIEGANAFKRETGKVEGAMEPLGNSNAEDELEEEQKDAAGGTYYEANPVIGKKIFDEYANQRIDKRGLRQEKPQKVVIEFTIDENGNLSDFHHIFSGCPECGAFAISILENSGEWETIPPGYSGRARYTFTF